MRTLLVVLALALAAAPAAGRDTGPDRAKVEEALRKAVGFFRSRVAVRGGYVWRQSADLGKREGEGRTHALVVWVQPPGTPSVGEAYLYAWRMTGEKAYLEAAVETAGALVLGQLQSGGWSYSIDFRSVKRKLIPYRIDGGTEGSGFSTLDDDTTQSALRFLMRVDRATEFKDASVHEAVLHALQSLIRAQYPNGAWPQAFERPAEPVDRPAKKASYPEEWSRTWTRPRYRDFYTLNDNVIPDMIDTMILAARIYDRGSARQAALKTGEFLLLAQMPDPQPAWAQQYDFDMHPAWARRFEPPAITGSESRGAIRALLTLYRGTGDRKWLEPIPKALDYFRKSRRSDGKLARFYELGTNRPLYFTKDYELTYDDSDVPTHYAFAVPDWVPSVTREYERIAKAPLKNLYAAPLDPVPPRRTEALDREVERIIAALDERGAWVEAGRLRYHGADDETDRIIDCATFAKNVRTLAAWLGATR